MILRYLSWHYNPGFKALLQIEKNFIDFGWYFFSINELSLSLFAPWHRIFDKKTGGVFSSAYWQAAWGNVISRVLGAMVRIITICIGFMFEAFVLGVSLSVAVIWLLMPFLIPLGYVAGFLLLFIKI